MKRLVAIIMVLAGAAAIAAAMLQRMEKATKIWVGAAGAAGTIGRADSPNVVFALKRVSAQTVLGLLRKISASISRMGAAYLYRNEKI